MINNIFNKNNLIFIGCLVFGFCVSFFLRQERYWDLLNYHYYNAFAFLNNRIDYDIVVGSINTFFNPLLDIPLYYMIQNFNDFPRLIFGIQGLYFGVCLFFFIKICGLFWNVDRREGICATAVAVIIAITGEAVGCQIGTSNNEIQVIAIFIPALYLLLKILIKPKFQKSWKFLAIGLGMGIALGLKQTVIIYCLSSGLTTIILYKRLKHPFKYICLFALGGALGYLVSNGWLMWRYWQNYQNPFFPFANAIFKSEWFDPINYRDTKFLPTLQNFWYFPLTMINSFNVIFEGVYNDIRLPFLYIELWIVAISLCFKKVRRFFKTHKKWKVYFVFMGTSFFSWMFLFSNLRYAIIIEMLSCIFVCAMFANLLFKLFKKNKKFFNFLQISVSFWGVLCLFGFFIYAPIYPGARTTTSSKFLYVEPLKFPENSVIKLYNFPSALYIAEWSKYNKIRGVGFKHYHRDAPIAGIDFVERGNFRKKRDAVMQAYKGPTILIYHPYTVLMSRPRMEILEELQKSVEKEIKEKNLYCRPIKQNFYNNAIICVPQDLKTQILGN